VVGAQVAADGGMDICLRASEVAGYLRSSRPTAVNLFWALDRMERKADGLSERFDSGIAIQSLLDEAHAIADEDRRMCQAIGRYGAELVPEGRGVLTHCNAGSLATAGDGTALSVLYAASDAGRSFHVFVDETRPLL